MYSIQQLDPPIDQCVTVAELADHLRLNTDAENDMLAIYLAAAIDMFQRCSNLQLNTATWALYLADWADPIYIPRGPVQVISSIVYTDLDDNEQPYTDYVADLTRPVPTITPGEQPSNKGITITFDAGFPQAEGGYGGNQVPDLIRLGILLLAAAYYENRESMTDLNLRELPMGFQAIVDIYKLPILTDLGAA